MGAFVHIVVKEIMKNCIKAFIDTFIEPSHRQAFDYSIRSLNVYEIYLNRNKKPYDSLVHKNLAFTILGSYLEEVIIRNFGGDWVGYQDTNAMLSVKEPLIFISVDQNYLANPISEVAWKLKYRDENRIIYYMKDLAEDFVYKDVFMKQDKSKNSENPKQKFNTLFHKDYLSKIFDYREYEHDELGIFMNYLTIPIVKMNEWFK